jgi:uncharacterized repeat protein (TIGR03837 family)
MYFSSLDIFCHVIDNFGDAGTVYRFAAELKRARPDCTVRVFIDNLEAVHTIDPSITPTLFLQEHGGISFIDSLRFTEEHLADFGYPDVLVEAYACRIPDWYMEKAVFNCPLIINLEYLSAEEWVEGYHCKESLLPAGTAKKFFFMPGFTAATGGILWNSRLRSLRDTVIKNRHSFIATVLEQAGCAMQLSPSLLTGSVFTYERGFDTLLHDCTRLEQEVLLLCFGTKTHSGMRHSLSRVGVDQPGAVLQTYQNVSIALLPFMPQPGYDQLLYCTDFNIVRGEDSWVQAIAAAKPFIWNAYIQDENYQQVKVDAFCTMFENFFDDTAIFAGYRELMTDFNDAKDEKPVQSTNETFASFFQNRKAIERATSGMHRFIKQNGDLVENFCGFILDF